MQINISAAKYQSNTVAYLAVMLLSLLLISCGGGGSSSGAGPSNPNNPGPKPIPVPSPEPSPAPSPAPSPSPELAMDMLVEAEDYVRFFDTDAGNTGGAYRNDDVDVAATTDNGGGFNVGWIAASEWLEYDVELVKGKYIVSTRVASESGGGRYQLLLNGTALATDRVKATGGWNDYETHRIALADVENSGKQVLRVEVLSGPFNLNWINLEVDDGSFTPPPEPPIEEPLPLPMVEPVTFANPISPEMAVQAMGVGINLGNTLDAPSEGAWAIPATRAHIAAFKSAGFKHVRIPVTWDNHTQDLAPYAVTQARMDRVEEIVTWVLEEDMYAIINVHHDQWIKEDFSQNQRNRFDSIWMQVAERFKNTSPKLVFEILNEPFGMSVQDVDTLNVRALDIIRNVSPQRLVVFSGNDYTPISALLSAAIPSDTDEYIIGNFHNYDPWPFAGQCVRGWGSQQDRDNLEAIYQQAADWSTLHDIPVTVNEFGSAKYDFEKPENVCATEDRLNYLRAHVEFATERGIAMTFWDDGGSFSSYDRENNTWGPEKDILVAPNLSPSE